MILLLRYDSDDEPCYSIHRHLDPPVKLHYGSWRAFSPYFTPSPHRNPYSASWLNSPGSDLVYACRCIAMDIWLCCFQLLDLPPYRSYRITPCFEIVHKHSTYAFIGLFITLLTTAFILQWIESWNIDLSTLFTALLLSLPISYIAMTAARMAENFFTQFLFERS